MRLSTIAACLMLATLVSADGMAARDKDAVCREIDRQIEQLHARMRQGYTAKQGVRLEKRLRDLRERRYELCR